jgi:hypothetical protein
MVNGTRIPIEQKESIRWLENIKQSTVLLEDPKRCIHIGDRESDIYELFSTAHEAQTNFLVRTCVDRRLTSSGKNKNTLVSQAMLKSPVRGYFTFVLPGNNEEKVTLQIKYATLKINPPVGKEKMYAPLTMTVIEATEPSLSKKRDPIIWKLLTNLPIHSVKDAEEKLRWYAMRWKIETFHKILKSGCKAEESRLRTAERLTNLIAIFCILSWRIFWMTMLKRDLPQQTNPELAFTKEEVNILTHLRNKKTLHSNQPLSLDDCLLQVAILGGYLARSNDPPPGNFVIWRGLYRLRDMALGFAFNSA